MPLLVVLSGTRNSWVFYLGFTIFPNVILVTGLLHVETSVLLGSRLRETCEDLT